MQVKKISCWKDDIKLFRAVFWKSGPWPSSFRHFTSVQCNAKLVLMLSTSLQYLKVPEQCIKQHDWHCHMWFVLPFSPLGEKWGVLFCFGMSFSHILHHVILLLLLANAAIAFVLAETNFPWNCTAPERIPWNRSPSLSLASQSHLSQQHPSVSRQ